MHRCHFRRCRCAQGEANSWIPVRPDLAQSLQRLLTTDYGKYASQWETQGDVGGPVVGGCCLHRYIKTCLGAQALPGEQQVLHLAMGLVAQIPM